MVRSIQPLGTTHRFATLIRSAAFAAIVASMLSGTVYACSGVPSYVVARDAEGATDASVLPPDDVGANDASSEAQPHVYFAFVTRRDYDGKFAETSPVTPADIAAKGNQLCGNAWAEMRQTRSLPADPRTWHALFFSQVPRSPISDIDAVSGGWHQPADGGFGPLMFADVEALKKKTLLRPFVDEYGAPLDGGFAWTGNVNATFANRCNDWQTNRSAVFGIVGSIAGPDWLESSASFTCDKRAHLYCLEQ